MLQEIIDTNWIASVGAHLNAYKAFGSPDCADRTCDPIPTIRGALSAGMAKAPTTRIVWARRTWLRYLSRHSPNPFRRHGIRLEGIRKSRHQV